MEMCSVQLLRPRSFSSWHHDLNFQRKVSVWNCHRFDTDPHATQPHSSHHSIHRNSSHHHTKNCPCRNCQWDTSVQIPRFLKLSLVSDFQDRIGLFSRFYSCTNLWHLCNLWMFLWIFTYSPFFRLPSLLDHDLLCLPLPDDCLPLRLRALQSR